MTRQITFGKESDMPYIPVSMGDMAWNRTGTWRTQKPLYENKTPPCNAACPAGNDIVDFILKVREGDVEGAWHLIKEENPLPGVCGRVCFHPCESKCNRGTFDTPIAIHALERFVADRGASLPQKKVTPAKKRIEKIAVIGSGPAGLTCAYHLARLHYPVTLFESLSRPGGILRTGIPSYRLPKDILDREISEIEALGVEIRTGVNLGRDLSLEALKEFQAVFLATGAHRGRTLQIPGEDVGRVRQGLDFLEKVNLREKLRLGERVVIIGGGNTAMDVARCVLRLGKKPTILYRRSREEMPAFEEEVTEALEEGVQVQFLVNPVHIHHQDGCERLECARMALGKMDETGRRRPITLPDSHFFVEADEIIVAAGEEIEISSLPRGLQKKEGIVVTGVGGETGHPGIFAGGDLSSNQRTVAHAIGSGKRAAVAIDCYLGKKDAESILRGLLVGEGPSVVFLRYLYPEEGIRNPHVVPFEELNMDYFERSPRQQEKKRGASARVKGFREVTATLTESAALSESERCFSCGTCTECENCYIFCPDASILKEEEKLSHLVAYDYCKGCGICFAECPRGAISLQEEAR